MTTLKQQFETKELVWMTVTHSSTWPTVYKFYSFDWVLQRSCFEEEAKEVTDLFARVEEEDPDHPGVFDTYYFSSICELPQQFAENCWMWRYDNESKKFIRRNNEEVLFS